jgi:predicted enzyme related to lactoylglutathione lyase
MKTLFKGIVWLGVKTEKFDQLSDFYNRILELPLIHEAPGFKIFDLPNGDRIELFAADDKEHAHFTTGPVVGFQVDDIESARKALEEKGVKFVGPIQGKNSKWAHFWGPDGNIYEITNRKTNS